MEPDVAACGAELREVRLSEGLVLSYKIIRERDELDLAVPVVGDDRLRDVEERLGPSGAAVEAS